MLFASREQASVTTILGSCISVCLWDPVLRVGGMNHYQLPLWNGEGLKTPRYGNIAIAMLIDKMSVLGCRADNLRAKVFGGANMTEGTCGMLNVGERNIMLAISTLEEKRIPVVGKDTGGTQARKLMFITSSGDVFVKK